MNTRKGMAQKDWKQEIKNFTDSELSQLLTSFENLKSWEVFNREFFWTGYRTIGALIENEIMTRKR